MADGPFQLCINIIPLFFHAVLNEYMYIIVAIKVKQKQKKQQQCIEHKLFQQFKTNKFDYLFHIQYIFIKRDTEP